MADLEAAGVNVEGDSPDQFLGYPLSSSISICNERSQAALAVLASAAMIYWASSMYLANRRWALALALVMVASALANGCLGVVQRVAWNEWTLLKFPNSSYYSTFVSRNSAADYFAIALGAVVAVLGVLHQSRKRRRRKEYRITYPSTSFGARLRSRMEELFIDFDSWMFMCVCAIVFLAVNVLATYSRGGTLATLGACAAA
jgi:hypothetical protein